MRTTLGRKALATAENADDRTRASSGISVRGVTGPLDCGAGAGAPGSAADGGLAGAACSAGASACCTSFRHPVSGSTHATTIEATLGIDFILQTLSVRS